MKIAPVFGISVHKTRIARLEMCDVKGIPTTKRRRSLAHKDGIITYQKCDLARLLHIYLSCSVDIGSEGEG